MEVPLSVNRAQFDRFVPRAAVQKGCDAWHSNFHNTNNMCNGDDSLAQESRAHTTTSPVSDYYAALGVKNDASEEELDASHKYLAKKLHPDRKNGDPAAITAVNEAREVLRDTGRRRAYDQWLSLDRETREKTNNGVFIGST